MQCDRGSLEFLNARGNVLVRLHQLAHADEGMNDGNALAKCINHLVSAKPRIREVQLAGRFGRENLEGLGGLAGAPARPHAADGGFEAVGY